MVLDVEVNLEIPWNEVEQGCPRGQWPRVLHDEVGPDQPTMVDLYRIIEELFDKSHRKLDELTEKIRTIRQRLAGLEQDTRQPRLAMEAEIPTYTKTRNRAEDAATDREKHEDSCSEKKVDPDLMCLTSFGDDSTEPPALPR